MNATTKKGIRTMPVLQEINFDVSKPRSRKGRKSMLILSESDDEDYDTAIKAANKKKSQRQKSLCLDDSEDDEESDGYLSPLEQDKENLNPASNKLSKRKQHPDSVKKTIPTTGDSKLGEKTPNPKPKKLRRRSSARFLRLSGRFDDEENEGIEDTSLEDQREKLNEMYSKAIQLNAANKINAVNSWGLNIIDKMDKFLGDDEEEDTSPNLVENRVTETNENVVKEKRVNFTKASCTIDACVKIYSYRVDDAHLTSYKVLANLNRTDGGKGAEKSDLDIDGEALDNEEGNMTQHSNLKRRDSTTVLKTVETNKANLNISNLDSTYDIDPIFHKMSQKFDEGGAKGLLLVNLGVANDGCRIVLDSKEESNNVPSMEPELTSEILDGEKSYEEGMLDISSLLKILEKKLEYSSIDSVPLVPQLSELRHMYDVLEQEGYVEASKNSKSHRYANNIEEDIAAEEAIHREALERSSASGIQRTSFLLPNNSMVTTNISMMGTFTSENQVHSNNSHHDDNNFGYDHDDWDDGDDGGFETYIAMDDHAVKYSSESFRNDVTHQDVSEVKDYLPTDRSNTNHPTLLDEICEGDALIHSNQFNYFDPKFIEKFTSGNRWAGSDHWRKILAPRPKKVEKNDYVDGGKKRKDSKRKTTEETKEKCLINFDISSVDTCLQNLLKKTKKVKGKITKNGQTQLTKAAKQKYDKENNLLPVDAEINMKHFTEFFMRPGATVTSMTNGAPVARTKSVGFISTDFEKYDDGIDDSYDDGPGFELAGNAVTEEDDFENFAVQELEGIRKVEKIHVKHATVAKKVDVKRLKHDLWTELEASTCPTDLSSEEVDGDDIMGMNESVEEKVVSFKETVKKLAAIEAQEDVSLPFYFICVLHLANERGLKLENREFGLSDFVISVDKGITTTE